MVYNRRYIKSIIAFIAAVSILLSLCAVPLSVLADNLTDEKTYNYSFDTKTMVNSPDGLLENYGITDLTVNPNPQSSPSNAYYAWEFSGSNGIRVSYGFLLSSAWGTINPNIVYTVKSGTSFSATGYITTNTSYKTNWENANSTILQLKLETSPDKVNWTEVASSGGSTGLVTMSADNLGDDVRYVRIVFPQLGKSANNSMGNDFISLNSVKFTPAVYDEEDKEDTEDIEYTDIYDYTALAVEKEEYISAESLFEKYGLFDAAINTNDTTESAAPLFVTKGVNSLGNGLAAGYKYLWSNNAGDAFVYATYCVKPATPFSADFYVSEGGKAAWEATECYEGKTFEFKLQSSSDGTEWKDVIKSGEAVGEFNMTIDDVGSDTNYIRIVFPQDGNCLGAGKFGGKIYNDSASVLNVKFNMGEPKLPEQNDGNYEKIIDFNKCENIGIIKNEETKASLGIYNMNGISVYEYVYRNKKVYLGANWSYIYPAVDIENPWVVYNVEPDTDFKVVSTHVHDVCSGLEEAIGVPNMSWRIKLYVSSDGEEWRENKLSPEYTWKMGLGRTETYAWRLDGDTKFVKIVLPHTGNMSGKPSSGNAGNDYMGIESISYTPAKQTEQEAVYQFDTTVDYNALGKCNVINSDNERLGIAKFLFGSTTVLNLRFGRSYLSADYSYLLGKQSVEKPYVIYNIKPETAFRLTAKYVSSIRKAMKEATGEDFTIKLYGSADLQNWSELSAEVSTMLDYDMDFDTTEIYTLPKVSCGLKYIKVEFPQSGDMSVVTNGKTKFVGNDFCGVQKVEFTRSYDIVSDIDISGYTFADKIDYSEKAQEYNELKKAEKDTSTVKTGAFETNAVVIDGTNGLFGASYVYLLKNTHRYNPYVVYNVKPSTSFYLETATRYNIYKSMQGEDFELRIMVSSDKVKWTDVTDQISFERYEGGDFAAQTLYLIEQLGSDINYVKVVFPQTKDYTDYVTQNGTVLKYVGNDYIGIKKAYFTSGNASEPYYEHILNYTDIYAQNVEMPDTIDEESMAVLGIADMRVNSLKIGYASEVKKRLIYIDNDYIDLKESIEQAYITYEVKPDTAFEIGYYVNEFDAFKVSGDYKLKVYVSETNSENLSDWTEITEGFMADVKAFGKFNAHYVFRTNNVGSNTNYVKIVFPQMGDCNIVSGGNSPWSGADYFAIEYVKASLKSYNPEYEGEEEPVYFFGYNPPKQTVIKDEASRFSVLAVVAISAGGVVVLAGIIFAVIILLKRKKSAVNKLN